MKLLKNKFLLTVLGIALAVAVSATVLAVMGVEDPVKNLFGTLTAPLRWCASKIAYGIEGFGVYFSSVEKLSEENAELRRENAELRAQLSDAQASARQDEYLRGYLGLDWLENNWSLSDATVIGRESGSYRTLYTLNRGSLHGIKRGMPVVTAEGLVGRVEQVGLGYCTVTSVLETTSSVGVYDARSGASGLLVGDLSLREQGKCKVTYVDIDADIELGDLIVTATSMHSRNNRAGILIGKGESPEQAVKEVGMVVEGINALPAAMELAEKYHVEMPIAQTVNAIVKEGMSASDALRNLMSRDRKSEMPQGYESV